MSDSTDNAPASSSASKKPRRPWRSKLWRAFLVVLTLALALRVILFFAIAPVMRKVAAAYGFDVSFQRQELTLLGGDVGLWGLKVIPSNGAEPVFNADYIRGYISVYELLKARLRVLRAEADGVDLSIERTADGRIPLLEQILQATRSARPKAPTPEKPLDFTSPLHVEAFRLQHVNARLKDAAVVPPVQAVVAMDVRVTQLGDPANPMQFEINIWSPQLLDSLRIAGQGTSRERSINLSADVNMRGFHPAALGGYLAPLGLRPIANNIGADLSASVNTDAVPASTQAIKARVALDKIRLIADGEDAAGVTKLQIDADEVLPQSVAIGQVTLDGGRIYASRSDKGLLRALGLEFAGAAPTTAPAPAPAPAAPPSVASASASPFKLSLKQIAITNAAALFRDNAMIPANVIEAQVSKLTVQGQSIDPLNPNAVIPLDGQITLPGIAKSVTLKGSVAPLAPTRTLKVQFDAAGIKPDAIKPYLATIGIESLLENASAAGQLDATLQLTSTGPVVGANMTGLKLTDGTELIAMDSAKFSGAALDTNTGRIKLQNVELSGPAVDVTRDASGRLTIAKFRWDPAILSKGPAASSTAPTTSTSVPRLDLAALPKLEVGALSWKGLRLRLRDEQTEPASVIAVEDAGVELKDFVFDLTSSAPGKAGSVRAWLASPQLARQASIEGTLQSGQHSFAADVKLRGEGIQTAILAPYIKPLGIEPTIHEGAAQADATINLTQTPDGISAGINLAGVSLKDGTVELGGVDSLVLEGATLGKSGIDIKSLEIVRPRSAIALEKDNTISALGVHLDLLRQFSKAPTTSPAPASPMALPAIALHTLRVTDGQLDWTDRGFATPVNTSGKATLELSDLKLGVPGAAPLHFRSVASASGVLEEITIEGTATPDPNALTLQASVNGHGIRAGALAAYLPKGIEFATQDGRIRAAIDASLTKSSQGGNEVKLSVTNVDWRDGESTPLFAMKSMRVAAPRIDLPGNVMAVDEISVAGVETGIERAADGSLRAAGVRLGGTPSVPANESVRPTPPGPSTTPVEDVATLIAEARKPLPLLTIKTLDLGVRRASVRDLSRADSAPLVAENIHVHNTAPIELGGETPSSRPPVKVDVEGQLGPVVDHFALSTTASPFASEPAASMELKASGIRGDGLTALVPEIRPYMNGANLTDGQFQTKLQSNIKFDRKGPRDFDLSRGFTMDLSVDPTTFRNGADGPLLAGVEGVRLEQAKIDPKTMSIAAKSLEITKPAARISRQADGIHAFGYVLPIERVIKPTTAPATMAVPSVSLPTDSKPSNEIRVDRLLVNGLDFRYEDHAVTPPVVAPINQLDLEVRDLTTMALYEPRTIRFAAILNADKIALPAAKAPRGATSRPLEDRDFFSQISSTGRIALYPKPSGYAKTSVNGLELAAFDGIASQFGAQVKGGVFDGTFDVRFRDNGDLDAKNKLVITELQYAEGSNGPLQNAFASPADLIIKAVEAPDKSITLPLDVQVKSNEISKSQIIGAAMGAASSVIVTAIASVPAKSVDTVTNVVGLGTIFGKKAAPPPPVEIEFAPGSTYLDPAARQKLAPVLEFAQKNKNAQIKITSELTAGDLEVASSRANPDLSSATSMADQLRSRKLALSQQRSQLAGQLRAQLVFLSANQSAAAVQQLRAIDAELGDIEQSLDLMYELQRPGAQLQASRRTRSAALEIVKQRLTAADNLVRTSPAFKDLKDKLQVESAKFQPTESSGGGKVILSIVGK
jgi:hypothetical protein